MTHDNPHASHTPADQVEFARQDLERGVLNEIVTEEQRQRQEIEKVIAEMLFDVDPCPYYAEKLEAILKR